MKKELKHLDKMEGELKYIHDDHRHEMTYIHSENIRLKSGRQTANAKLAKELLINQPSIEHKAHDLGMEM